MPISFYSMDESRPREGIAWLCDQNWNIAEQVDYLSDWLKQIEGKIEKGSYVADIGFVTRRDASGGGASHKYGNGADYERSRNRAIPFRIWL